VLLDGGRVIACGTPAELVSSAGLRPSVRLRLDRPLAAGDLGGAGEARPIGGNDRELVVEVRDSSVVPALLETVGRRGAAVLEMSLHQPNLADVFFALTGRALRDETGGAPP
ncbi:MAG: daunorubicin/doxorubicin resistance ABC transporter ATP-binding protein DrrA, partial [Candidatus Binatia bacterium]